MSANSTQVGGTHYKGLEYQHWDMAWDLCLGYYPGQITKYIMRWRNKNGLADVQKAAHFLMKYQEVIGDRLISSGMHTHKIEAVLRRYVQANLADPEKFMYERSITYLLGHPHDRETLNVVRKHMDNLILQATNWENSLAAAKGFGYVNQG